MVCSGKVFGRLEEHSVRRLEGRERIMVARLEGKRARDSPSEYKSEIRQENESVVSAIGQGEGPGCVGVGSWRRLLPSLWWMTKKTY